MSRYYILSKSNSAFTLQVKASIAMVEADEIQKGIVELLHRYGVRKLVMGAEPER